MLYLSSSASCSFILLSLLLPILLLVGCRGAPSEEAAEQEVTRGLESRQSAMSLRRRGVGRQWRVVKLLRVSKAIDLVGILHVVRDIMQCRRITVLF
jgi:hypothetical protein